MACVCQGRDGLPSPDFPPTQVDSAPGAGHTHTVQQQLLHLSWGPLSSSGQQSNRDPEGLHNQRHTVLWRRRADINREPVLVSGALPATPLSHVAFVSKPQAPSPAVLLGLEGFPPSARQSVHLGILGWGAAGTSRGRADSHEWRQGFQGHVSAHEAMALSSGLLSLALPLGWPVGPETDPEELGL